MPKVTIPHGTRVDREVLALLDKIGELLAEVKLRVGATAECDDVATGGAVTEDEGHGRSTENEND
jgi:hypothetical protein